MKINCQIEDLGYECLYIQKTLVGKYHELSCSSNLAKTNKLLAEIELLAIRLQNNKDAMYNVNHLSVG